MKTLLLANNKFADLSGMAIVLLKNNGALNKLSFADNELTAVPKDLLLKLTNVVDLNLAGVSWRAAPCCCRMLARHTRACVRACAPCAPCTPCDGVPIDVP